MTDEEREHLQTFLRAQRSTRSSAPPAAPPRSTTKHVTAERKPKAMSKPQHDAAELMSIKRKLHASIRAKFAAMTPAERSRYTAALQPEQRRLHAQICGISATSAPRPRPHADFATLDVQWGIGPKPAAVTRTPGQISCSALGTSKPTRKQPPQPSAADAPAQQGHLYPRVSASGHVTAHSAHAAELDRAMGIQPAKPRARRESNTLTFSAAD